MNTYYTPHRNNSMLMLPVILTGLTPITFNHRSFLCSYSTQRNDLITISTGAYLILMHIKQQRFIFSITYIKRYFTQRDCTYKWPLRKYWISSGDLSCSLQFLQLNVGCWAVSNSWLVGLVLFKKFSFYDKYSDIASSQFRIGRSYWIIHSFDIVCLM